MRQHAFAIALCALCAAATLPHALVMAQGALPTRELALPAAEALLLDNNREIRRARRAIEQAEADIMIAGQKPNPQLGVALQNINRSRGIGAGGLRDKTVDTIVGVSQLIERGGKAELRVAAAQSLADASRGDSGETVRTQLLALRYAYYDTLAAQEKLVGAGANARLYEASVAAATMRLRAGDLSGADVARIRVDAARARNDVTTVAAELARARLGLAVLIGAETDAAALRAVSAWPPTDTAAPTDTSAPPSEDWVTRRPDVRAAAARVAAAVRLRDLARSLRTRDISVSAQFEHWPVSDANPAGSGNSFGVGIALPLFLRHSYEGEAARAQADWYAARDEFDRIVALAHVEIARSRADLDAARERRNRIDSDLLPQARKSADAAEFAFRNGAIGVMDLLDARRTLRAIEIEATAARADHARALAALRAGVEELPTAADARPGTTWATEPKQ